MSELNEMVMVACQVYVKQLMKVDWGPGLPSIWCHRSAVICLCVAILDML